MNGNFAESLALVLKHEGGYVNHPKDPGGATNQGVTQATYNAWRERKGLAKRSVRDISSVEIEAIYRQNYWNKVRGDDLPSGVDYAVFDFAVNSGPSRAAKYLQRVVGVDDDGVIGPVTLAAVAEFPPGHIIADLCDDRMVFLQWLPHWPTFKNGWTRRVADVQIRAMKMADRPSAPPSKPPVEAPEPTPEPSGSALGKFLLWLVSLLGIDKR